MNYGLCSDMTHFIRGYYKYMNLSCRYRFVWSDLISTARIILFLS